MGFFSINHGARRQGGGAHFHAREGRDGGRGRLGKGLKLPPATPRGLGGAAQLPRESRDGAGLFVREAKA